MRTSIYEKYIKRAFDFVIALIALFVLFPMFIVIAILVRIELGSPVIFVQERPGKDERIFKLYKFRTMTSEHDESDHLLSDEQRITTFGKKLRATSLDELPELWNIIRGDMSIVGPRPLLKRYLPYYRNWERQRHSVRPGLTGLAQINGRNLLQWEERFRLDVEYVQHVSFRMDFEIILLTIRKVLKRQDITVGKEMIVQDLDVERSSLGDCDLPK